MLATAVALVVMAVHRVECLVEGLVFCAMDPVFAKKYGTHRGLPRVSFYYEPQPEVKAHTFGASLTLSF
jgi:hypothetical protein